jgi:hypothetical protein
MILEKKLSRPTKWEYTVPDQKPSIPTRWEYIVPALATASLIVSCIIISSKKLFWNDELLSYYLLGDRSFKHMLVAFSDKFSNVPPLYFILGWLWAKAFSSTELSLRLFSSLGISIACVTIWITLRRTYNFWSASIGTLGVFCVSNVILYQNAEARMYGLFLAVCSLGLLQFDVINKRQKCSWGIIVSNTCIHAAIVLTHLFGILYSGAILSAFIVRDKYFKVFRPTIYLSIVLSWLSLIPYIPSFLNQADAGNPRVWIPMPNLKDLINSYGLSTSSFLQFVLLFLLAISSLQLIHKAHENQYVQISKKKPQNSNSEISLLILAYALLTVPVLVWIISRTIKPILVDRYMIPSTLSWSILLAYLSSRIILPNTLLSKRISGKLTTFRFLASKQSSILLLMLIVVLLIHPVIYAKSLSEEQLPGLNDDKYGYRDLPIVAQFSHDFIKRFHYSPERNRYFFILDWQAALDSRSGLFSPQEYKTMDALKRNYPSVFHNNIVQIEDFLKTHNRFLVLDYLDYDKKCTSQDFHCPRWLEMRIKSSSNYKITPLGVIEGRELLLVESKTRDGKASHESK